MKQDKIMNKKNNLKILVTNDDGIDASGIKLLAAAAQKFGTVYAVAPEHQCSGMSQKLTITESMVVKEKPDFPVLGVKAWSVSGTPADCVKTAVLNILDVKPDIVFSGINYGFNAGYDIAYSGTVGAALEALLNGIPAIAFSNGIPADGSVLSGRGFGSGIIEEKITGIIEELFDLEIEPYAFWNVNFPACSRSELRGILRDRKIAKLHPYQDNLVEETGPDGSRTITVRDYMVENRDLDETTDIWALLNNYISIGKVYNAVMI